MSSLEKFAKTGSKDWAVAGNTDFKYTHRPDGDRINTDTIISLSHVREEGESLEDFKLRVVETIYGRIQALYDAFPHEIEAAGITMKIS